MKKFIFLIILLTGIVFFYGNCSNDEETGLGICDDRSTNDSCTLYKTGDGSDYEAACVGNYTEGASCPAGYIGTCTVGDTKTIYYYGTESSARTACSNTSGGTYSGS